eukprot:CAMPEP_0118699922 /NCGR_PEP_ID=MMETSP0800-20121206/16227_1 /TAXON_ID=210618 ORGANISM="Striatella unipunctata, Strain CCMP2910" /NCGR_SAMPLE_ID=MMETSP0800 /ASSEMBLY_ACC=CAM_ASM_000638 /LENGTH=246 /DNA_ID=CAMNT_0006600311 /DNA_START=89 /DNA_END=829 /DNA_ORIENTATION=+
MSSICLRSFFSMMYIVLLLILSTLVPEAKGMRESGCFPLFGPCRHALFDHHQQQQRDSIFDNEQDNQADLMSGTTNTNEKSASSSSSSLSSASSYPVMIKGGASSVSTGSSLDVTATATLSAVSLTMLILSPVLVKCVDKVGRVMARVMDRAAVVSGNYCKRVWSLVQDTARESPFMTRNGNGKLVFRTVVQAWLFAVSSLDALDAIWTDTKNKQSSSTTSSASAMDKQQQQHDATPLYVQQTRKE